MNGSCTDKTVTSVGSIIVTPTNHQWLEDNLFVANHPRVEQLHRTALTRTPPSVCDVVERKTVLAVHATPSITRPECCGACRKDFRGYEVCMLPDEKGVAYDVYNGGEYEYPPASKWSCDSDDYGLHTEWYMGRFDVKIPIQ
jgi:hypothetical protein